VKKSGCTSPTPRAAVLHDLSGIGRCSLTAVIPILSARGIQACPLPTALLSTQTDGFENYYFQDLTESMIKIMAHWKEEHMEFDGIYSGFLGSPEQARVVGQFIEDFRREKQLVVVDPVMGDNGEFYGPYTRELIDSMKELITKADLITPNFTEAAFLLGEDYSSTVTGEELKSWCRRLSDRGPGQVIITSVPLGGSGKEKVALAAWDRDKDSFFLSSVRKIPIGYPGTGDAFTSLIMADLMNGKSFQKSIKRAERKIKFAIRKTRDYNLPRREGILLEKYLLGGTSRG
jgi:pyridoxine kinase